MLVRLAGAVSAVAALALAHQARRLWRATTMEADHAAYWRRRARSPGERVLVALGDSLAQGLGAVHPERSWAGRLAAHLEVVHGVRVQVLNLGACGATVADVVRDQLPSLPASAFVDASVTVAVAVGTNDAAQGVDPAAFRARLAALCAALPAGTLVADVPDLQREPVRAAGVRLSAVAREVLAAYPALRPVALEAATHRMRLPEFGPDLSHPSGLGYRRFGAAFVAALP